jgi:DEAD/DEAH box helicase domain-containing protein
VYSYSQDKYYGFFEKDLQVLEKILVAEKPVLIGFNSIHFDVPVLQPYFEKVNLAELPQLDILKEIEKVLGHRLKLDSVGQATIFSKKSGMGLDAIRWYREGDFDSLAKYCLDDVAITRDVYEYGLRHGRLYYSSGGQKVPIPIQWGVPPFIAQRIAESHAKHEQLDIEYFTVDEAGDKTITSHTIEILSMEPNRFEAYDHTANGKRTFEIPLIWSVKENGSTFAYQSSLF